MTARRARTTPRPNAKKTNSHDARSGLAGLLLTAFAANACIMTLELVAGRLVARYIGQSLYTWTAIMGVVLLGMSIGSYAGGRLADRHAPLKLLPVLLLLAGASFPAVLALNAAAGHFPLLRELAWPARILLHVLTTFLIPCIFLGSLTPVILREALRASVETGRIIGLVYGASALGSVLGTFGAGFVLIPTLGTRLIVLLIGTGLGALGLNYAWTSRNRGATTTAEAASPAAQQPAPMGAAVWKALGAVFIANASFMVYELAASRMATQYLGHSIYTWTSLLGVVLAGIMAGNYAGGRLSDRVAPEKLLPWSFAAAALVVLASPGIHRWFAESLVLNDLLWTRRIFVQTALSFFAPSVALGIIGPAAARNAIAKSTTPGRTVGLVYAAGSIASVAGTFVTGYALVDLVWPIGTMLLLGAFLAASACLYGRRSRAGWAAAAVAALAIILACIPGEGPRRIARSLGLIERDGPEFVYRDHSQYSWVSVTAASYQPSVRSLYLDQLLHSTVDTNQPLKLDYEYEQIYRAVLDLYYPEPQQIRASVIGGGGFVYPRYLELTRPGSYIETVEIDPAVTEAAQAAFGLPRDTRIAIYEMDGRNRIEDLARTGGETFDCIFGDSFNQYSVPFQLTTLEFDQRVFDVLKDDGMYFMNLIESMQRGPFLGSVVRTMRLVFPAVYAIRTDAAESRRDTFVVLGSKRPLDLGAVTQSLRAQYNFRGGVVTDAELDEIIARNDCPVLTDDFAPVDNMVGPLIDTRQSSYAFEVRQRATDLLRNEKHDEALPLLETLHTLEPYDVEVVRDLALLRARRGELDKAQPYFELAARMAPDSYEIRYNLGLLYSQMGDPEGAVRELGAAHGLRPTDAASAFALGSALNAAGRPDEAIESLRAGTLLETENASGHVLLANTLAMLKRFDEAKSEFSEAIRIAPEFPGARENLARVHLNLKEYSEARAQYVRMLELEPTNPMILYLFGVTLEAEGRPGEAIEYYRLALEIEPGLEDAKAALERAKNAIANEPPGTR